MPALALPLISNAISASNPASTKVPSCLFSRRRLGEASRATNRSGHPSSSISIATTPSARPTNRSSPERSEEHTSELQSRLHLVCRLLLEKKKTHQTSSSRNSPSLISPPFPTTRSSYSCSIHPQDHTSPIVSTCWRSRQLE